MLSAFHFAGQGPLQLAELTLAFILSALVGLEREARNKAAGLRTYCLVGVSAALFMLVSKYGFDDVLQANRIVLDPSRVAAQIVSGIGFIGGGVIFMRRDAVRGLTTAASIWLTAALGMACGAGLPVLALAVTAGHFIVMLAFPPLVARFMPQERRATRRLHIVLQDGRARLQDILLACSELRFSIHHVEAERQPNGAAHEALQDLADAEGTDMPNPSAGATTMTIEVKGKRPITDLVARLGDTPGVLRVGTLQDSGLD